MKRVTVTDDLFDGPMNTTAGPIFTKKEMEQPEKKRPKTSTERVQAHRAKVKASGVSTLDTPEKKKVKPSDEEEDQADEKEDYKAPRYRMALFTLGRNDSYYLETEEKIREVAEMIIKELNYYEFQAIEYVIEHNFKRRKCVDPYNYHVHIALLKMTGITNMEWIREVFVPLHQRLANNEKIIGTLEDTRADEKRQLYYYGYIRKYGFPVVTVKWDPVVDADKYLAKLIEKETKEFTLIKKNDIKADEGRSWFFSSNASDFKNHIDRVIQLMFRDLEIKVKKEGSSTYTMTSKDRIVNSEGLFKYLCRIPALQNIKNHKKIYEEKLEEYCESYKEKQPEIKIEPTKTETIEDSDIEEL